MADIKTAITYFWSEEKNLPHNMGYPAFSICHLLTLALVLISIGAGYIYFRHCSKNHQIMLLRIIAVFLPCLETLKLIIIIRQNAFNPSYLPLYMCSIGMYLFPVIAFSHNQKVVNFLATISLLILMPGAFTALFFPDWIGIYHPLSFMSIYSFLWHALIIAFPIYAHAARLCMIKNYSILYGIPFFAIIIPLIKAADHIFGCNFWFIETPAVNNPFSGIYESYGYPVYIAALFITCFTLMFISQSIFILVQKKRKKDE